MDPDECLKNIRAQLTAIKDLDDDIDTAVENYDYDSASDLRNSREEYYESLTYQVAALDEWMSKGGFMLKAWAKNW